MSIICYEVRIFKEADMYTYGSIYLIAKDFDKSISFYRALFERDVLDQNKTVLQYLT